MWEHLRPSLVETRRREVTQPQARSLFQRHPRVLGLRWWSTYQALWSNVTLFDRGADALRVRSLHALTIEDPVLVEAAAFFGLRVSS